MPVSASARAVTSASARSSSLAARSRSPSRSTRTAGPNASTHRANGSGTRKRSQECRRRAGRALTASGTTGAPVSAASVTTPALELLARPARAVGNERHVHAAPERRRQGPQRHTAAA